MNRRSPLPLLLASALGLAPSGPAVAVDMAVGAPSFLTGLHHHSTVASTVPANGDQNPYAVVVSPVTRGRLVTGHVLVSNFNDASNLQGLGTTIVSIDPVAQALTIFAQVPQHLDGCPGGVGLTAAMTVLKSGWVVVGSLPSRDGTAATKGDGCLMLFGADGRLADVWTSPRINGPWGNMAVVDDGDRATLFVSNTGFGVGAVPAGGTAPVVPRATVVRIGLRIPAGAKPRLADITVVADGFGEQADRGVFVIGPTGVALGPNGSIYVSDAIGNRIMRIPDALTRTASAGTGVEVTRDGLLKRPLSLVNLPNGHLLATNGLNGQVVEIDPAARRQVTAQWVDADRAQQPAGSGDLFSLAVAPGGTPGRGPGGAGLYYVEDDVNTLMLAH